MTRGRIVAGVLLSVFALLGGIALAQEGPEAEAFEAAFLQHVPPGWSLEEFVIEVQENYGTAVEPDIRTRFHAIVEAEQDTFALAGELEGAKLLRPIISTGERRTFYGIAASVRRQGSWETRFTLENNPTADTGSVIDYFSGVRAIIGSEEEAALRRQLQEEAEAETAAEVARLKRAEQLREQERESELAEVAHAVQLSERQKKAEQEAMLARAAYEAELAAAWRAQEEATLATRREEISGLLDDLPGVLEKELARHLPSYWTIEKLTITESAHLAGYDDPTFWSQFRANLRLDEDLFTSRREDGNVLLLDSTLEKGFTYGLQGTAGVDRVEGIWQVSMTFENLEGMSGGRARGQYPLEALVAGSPEETAFWEALEQRREQAKERELAEIRRQQEVETARHEAERSAAAEAAQLLALNVAARAAQLRNLEASLADTTDTLAYVAAVEAILKDSADAALVTRATQAAIESRNAYLVTLALRRTLLGNGSISLTTPGSNLSQTIWLTDITETDNGSFAVGLRGSHSRWNCGGMTGHFDNGRFSAWNDTCTVSVQVTADNQLMAEGISSGGSHYVFYTDYPGIARKATEN